MHAVDCEVVGDSSLGCCETLCDDGATIDSASPWRMPERPGVGEHVLEKDCQHQECSRLWGRIRDKERAETYRSDSTQLC